MAESMQGQFFSMDNEERERENEGSGEEAQEWEMVWGGVGGFGGLGSWGGGAAWCGNTIC